MLQRIQTLFLLIAITAISLSFVFPIAKIQTGDEVTALYTNYGLKSIDGPGKSHIMESGFIFIVAAGALITLLIALSQFKKRKLQITFCRFTYAIILIQIVLSIFQPNSAAQTIKFAGEIKVAGYDLGFYMPIIALFFTFLAENFIRRDEKLVKSADRLR